MEPLLLNILECPCCGNDLQNNEAKNELVCLACETNFPVIYGVPVLFPDEKRRNFTVDNVAQNELIQKVEILNDTKLIYRDELKGKINTEDIDALLWEKLFWKNWKKYEDYGTIKFDKQLINDFLKNDIEGGTYEVFRFSENK